MALESEVKFPVGDTGRFIALLDDAGAEMRHERALEENWLYDNPEGRLARRTVLLRLRSYGDLAVLTVKRNPREADGMKIREEHEISFCGMDEAHAILEALGYHPVRRYQKYRTIYRIDDLELCLDETPIGSFVEIEGERDDVYALADRIGLDERSGLTISYLALYRMHGGTGDMLFP